MYVEPSTDVYILKNCPLESSYEHTVIFESKEKQEQYFLSLAKYHPTAGDQHHKATYQRVNLNALKIELPVEKLYDCNYMMFRNEYFENKWFYAFITSVEYVNNRTSLINYYIDVMQTWFFEAKLGECFVEREHVYDDRIGANTVPENLEMGDMIYHYMDKADDFSWKKGDYYIEIITTFNKDGSKDSSQAGLIGGVYSGLNYLYYDSVEDATAFLQAVVEQSGEDAVIAVYMIPKQITTYKGQGCRKQRGSVSIKYATSWEYDWIDNSKDGYEKGKTTKAKKPKNNKIYTYPFTTIICNNMVGGLIEYKPELVNFQATNGHDETGAPKYTTREEYLDTKKERFYYSLEGLAGAPPTCLMMPMHYNGQENCRNEQLTIDNFPQCAFVTDTYRSWVAMNYRSYNVAGIGSLITGGLGAITSAFQRNIGGVFNNIAGAGLTIAEQVAEKEKAKILPNKAHGMTAPTLAMGNDSLGFRFYCAHPRPEMAKRIDDYFERYGYQVNENKIPNRDVRPHWCYTKTANCVIIGDLPDDDKQKIIAVYNRGITFWKKPEEIGNYELDNTALVNEATTTPSWVVDEKPDYDGDWEDAQKPDDKDTPVEPSTQSLISPVKTTAQRNNNAKAIYNILKSFGWADNPIYAVLGNFQQESDLDYNASGGGYGLAQWRLGRAEALDVFITKGGYLPNNEGLGQLSYLDQRGSGRDEWIAKSPYRISFNAFKTDTEHSVDWLTAAFDTNYERSGGKSLTTRKRYANKWKEYLS